MHHQLLVVLVLLFVVVLVHSASARLRLSFPILLVLVGLGTGLFPGLPHVTLAPDLVFLVFLPPLLLPSLPSSEKSVLWYSLLPEAPAVDAA